MLSPILPHHTARYYQLCRCEFYNDDFTWQGTKPLPATENVPAPLREAQYLLKLFVTLVALQKGFRNKILRVLSRVKCKNILRCEML